MSDESVIAETRLTGAEPWLALPPALATPPGAGAVCDDAGARKIGRGAAEGFFSAGPVMVAHASLTARRLGLTPPPRSAELMDVLELYAFVRPARFCAPSPTGLALSLGLAEPKSAEEQAAALREAAGLLLRELAQAAYPEREAAYVLALTMQRAGWAWGERVVQALEAGGVRARQHRGSGLDVWSRLTEWEDEAPRGEAGSAPVDSESARIRLEKLLQASGLDETRPTQSDYAAEAAFAFSPRNEEGRPRVLLAEAGTGTGKTLGYLAPASLWAERNQGAAWISTYTRALQRQIDRESHSLWPDPAERKKKAVIRKGRENYLCVLNLQDMVQAAQLGNGDLIGLALAGRWALHTRDGDMTGGDFPGWLPGLFAMPAAHAAGAANLVDRRGECVHAACPHYRSCFVEKTIRASRRAGGLGDWIGHRLQRALHAELGAAVGIGLGRAGPKLVQRSSEEGLDWADGIDLSRGRGHAARYAFARKRGRGADGVLKRLQRRLIVPDHVAQPLFQPAPATPPPLRPPDPAAQLGRLLTRKTGGKGAVGGVEQMVALVEDDAFQGRRLAVLLLPPRGPRAVERRLGQDQGVVGDDQVRAAAGANGLLDETAAIVGTGRVDAFAPPIHQIGRPRRMGRRHGE